MASPILLVEDDSLLLEVLERLLTKAGFSVVVAIDGPEAIQRLEELSPSLVLLDLVIPRLDGFEVLKQIRANPKFAHVPVIILSNLGSPEDIKKATDLGAADYWIKAASVPEEIIRKVHAVLDAEPKGSAQA